MMARIGVDLDGTLVEYAGWGRIEQIGSPIPAMAERVQVWLAEDHDVVIFTARVSHLWMSPPGSVMHREAARARQIIQDWTQQHFGARLEVTAIKDFAMREIWDDRCVQVETNTGRRIDGEDS